MCNDYTLPQQLYNFEITHQTSNFTRFALDEKESDKKKVTWKEIHIFSKPLGKAVCEHTVRSFIKVS